MPQGQTPEELAKRSGFLSDICKEHGYRFCQRLHIDLYGGKRGT
jgi:7-carboxy-7-deazaguanine synthase